jgi:hypothetical protein
MPFFEKNGFWMDFTTAPALQYIYYQQAALK